MRPRSARLGKTCATLMLGSRSRRQRLDLFPRACVVIQAHGVLGQAECLARLLAGAAAALGQDVLDQIGLALVLGASLADRVEEAVQRRDQLLLDLDVADLALDVTRLE